MLILGALWLVVGLGLSLLIGAAVRYAESSEDSWLEFCHAHGLLDPAQDSMGV